MGEVRVNEPAFVSLLDIDGISTYWPQILGSLQHGLLLDYYDPQELLKLLCTNKMQLWIVGRHETIEIIIFTELILGSRKGKVLSVLELIGKGLTSYLDDIRSILTEAARRFGCSYITIPHARPEWERLLPDFSKKAVVLEMCLDETPEEKRH